jgi:hypothetical protein
VHRKTGAGFGLRACVNLTASGCVHEVMGNEEPQAMTPVGHDDALCTNGSESRRPYLRLRDAYITPDELMASAQEWAAVAGTRLAPRLAIPS